MPKKTSGSWTEVHARAEVARFVQSGESLDAYCARTGVSARQLVYWRGRLSGAAPAGPRMVELKVAGPASLSAAVEIGFPSGHVVRLAGGVPLVEVLRAVAVLGC